MIPVYGFLQGDTLGLLILAEEEETIASLADKLVRSSSVRVHVNRTRMVYAGRALDPDATVKGAGIKPLSRFDVLVPEDP